MPHWSEALAQPVVGVLHMLRDVADALLHRGRAIGVPALRYGIERRDEPPTVTGREEAERSDREDYRRSARCTPLLSMDRAGNEHRDQSHREYAVHAHSASSSCLVLQRRMPRVPIGVDLKLVRD